jgi:glycosyltransferase involved in cell wall biosynthesis
MAAACPVVSTSIGAEGLDCGHGENILLADTPQAFADACLSLLDDPGTRGRLRRNARDLVASRYSWASVASRFEQALFA